MKKLSCLRRQGSCFWLALELRHVIRSTSTALIMDPSHAPMFLEGILLVCERLWSYRGETAWLSVSMPAGCKVTITKLEGGRVVGALGRRVWWLMQGSSSVKKSLKHWFSRQKYAWMSAGSQITIKPLLYFMYYVSAIKITLGFIVYFCGIVLWSPTSI